MFIAATPLMPADLHCWTPPGQTIAAPSPVDAAAMPEDSLSAADLAVIGCVATSVIGCARLLNALAAALLS